MTGPLSLLASADLLGRIRYVELACFERLGRRARTAVDPPTAAYLSGASLAHAWRAALVEDHLPVSRGLPSPPQLTKSPGAHLDGILDLLGPPETPGDEAAPGPGPDPSAEVLEALVAALYPAMLASYDQRIAIASPASDPPLVRTLQRAAGDLRGVLEEGRTLLGAHPRIAAPTRTGDRPRLVDRVRHLLDGGPGPFGPVATDSGA